MITTIILNDDVLERNIADAKWQINYHETKLKEFKMLLEMYNKADGFEQQISDTEWNIKHNMEKLEDHTLILRALKQIEL